MYFFRIRLITVFASINKALRCIACIMVMLFCIVCINTLIMFELLSENNIIKQLTSPHLLSCITKEFKNGGYVK